MRTENNAFVYVIVSGTIVVGGSETVKLSREDYDYAVLASKPSGMTLVCQRDTSSFYALWNERVFSS